MKNEAKLKVFKTIKDRFGMITLYNTHRYLMLSNFFASKGFKITLDNKEDVMLNIITSSDSDPDLISKLERYLMCYDQNITSDQQWYQKYEQFLQILEKIDNEKDIKEQTALFLSYFR